MGGCISWKSCLNKNDDLADKVGMGQSPEISFVIPSFDESGTLEDLVAQIEEVMSPLQRTFEILIVDDGSTDQTPHILERLCGGSPRIRGVRLRRRQGKATALAVAFSRVRGEYILTMDADLQDDPAEIPRFIAELDKGFDMVNGWKARRMDVRSRRWLSRVFNWSLTRFSGLSLRDINSGFKGYRRSVVDSLVLYGGLHRFIPILAHHKGFSIVEIPVNHSPRRIGRSKYGLARIPRGLLDFIAVIMLTGSRSLLTASFAIWGIGLIIVACIAGLASLRAEGDPVLFLGTGMVAALLGMQSLGLSLLIGRKLPWRKLPPEVPGMEMLQKQESGQ